MNLRIIESICLPGKIINEDLLDYNAQAGWVWDGVTGLGAKIIEDAPSDANWFVQSMNAALKSCWNNDITSRTLFKLAAEDVIDQFSQQKKNLTIPFTDQPTACLLMARIWNGKLELSTAGDCWCVRSMGDKIVEFGKDLTDEHSFVMENLEQLKALGYEGQALRERHIPFERKFRAQANTPDKHVIVDLTTRWVDMIHQDMQPIFPGDHILLMSDGFYRLIDIFERYTARSLLAATQKYGLHSLYEELRMVETRDEECKRYPRVKRSDDVAALLMKAEL